MAPKPSRMRLTPELVARVLSADDSLPQPFTAPSDADHDDTVRAILAAAPSADEVWLFAYESLMWNPACDFVEQRVGFVPGWHRSFCLGWDRWFRGSDSNPGLMLSLDRGGQCKGAVYRLPPDAIEANLGRLFRREMRAKPSAHSPRWVNVRTENGPLQAITFVINRNSGRYVRGLSLEQIADALAVACGPWGSMADYLHSTVSHLEGMGIHDSQLWRLQELVAERIEASTAEDLPAK
ncbi:MAG: gamma-glutamylcyclotransferase [Mesorhizobium sp.]|nr:MAG: gamma-glutamylcyclotransferase [Mesorhizobium sp.]